MSRRPVAAVVLTTAAMLLGACSAEPDGPTRADPSESPSSSTTQPTTETNTEPPEQAPAREPMTVVGHATRAQLDLTRAQARAAERGRAPLGFRLVETVGQVERDPGAVAVVPLSAVGPTVVAARVEGVDPVRDSPEATRVTVVGDVMLVRGVPDPAASLTPMRRLLRGADLTVGNLESTLSVEGEPTQGGDSFGATPALLDPLRRAGFDALSLANNHAGDYGSNALVETVDTMVDSPIAPFGAGPDLATASRPAILERDGVRFAFVGFNAIGETFRAAPGQPGALSVRMPPRTGPLVDADLDHVADVVRRAGRRADVVVAMPHWGTQYTHTPEPIQRTVAQRLVEAGADLVVGGHPHWVQGLDAVRSRGADVPVIHSLGNFVFDMDFMEQTLEGVVLETTWWGAELKAIRLVPYRMDPVAFAPRVVIGDDAAGILADVRSTSTGPYAP